MALMTASGGLSNSKLALANAGTEDVLSGKTYYAGDKNLKTGDMPNNGAWSSSVGQGESITIPKGYHNGMGKVSAKTQKTVFLGYAGTASNAWSRLTYNVKNNYPSIYSKLTRADFYAVPYRWQGNSTDRSSNNGSSSDNIGYNSSTGILTAGVTTIGPGGTWAGVLNYKIYMVYYE